MFLAFALLVIAFATLWPMPGPSHQWAFCLACGAHGTSDLLLNIALFMPLGAALALRGRRSSSIAAVAGLLSAAIELSQFYIPGRDPSLSDIVSNTLGGVLGALLVRSARFWLFPRTPDASWLCRGAALGAALICLSTGLLLTPSFPAWQYYGLWTPNFPELAWYRGHVLNAAIGATPIRSAPIPARDHVRDLLQSPAGYELRVQALAGPPPQNLAPLFTIVDDWRREVVLVGVDRAEFVFRARLRAAAWRFDRPDVRVFQPVRSGDTIFVRVTARNGHYSINGVERGFTVGNGWALLLYPEALPFKNVLSALWIGALFIPAGFWLRTRIDGVTVALGLLSGLLLVPALTPLLPTPLSHWVAAGLGLLGGAYLGRLTGAGPPRPA